MDSYHETSGAATDHDERSTSDVSEDSSPEVPSKDWKEFFYVPLYSGVALASVSGLLFTANNFVINRTGVDVGDVVLVRTAVQIAIYVSVLLSRGETVLPRTHMDRLYTILQGVTGSVAFICGLSCVSFMDVPDALCIMFACPVVTIILSALMLRDKLNIVKICAGGLLLSGVLLVCRPPFLFDTLTSLLGLDPTQEDDMYAIGVVLAITACVSGGLMDVLVAKCENVSASVLLLWTAMFGLVIAVIYGVLHPGSNILSRNCLNIPPQDWGIFFGLAISGLLAFTTLTRSLQLISPNLVASLRTLELVLAFTVQSLLSGVPPGILSCLGGTFILLGVLMLAAQDQILRAKSFFLSFLKELLSSLTTQISEPDEYTRLLP